MATLGHAQLHQVMLDWIRNETNSVAAKADLLNAAGATMEKRTTQRERDIKRLYDSFTAQQAATTEAEDQLDLLHSTAQKACSRLLTLKPAYSSHVDGAICSEGLQLPAFCMKFQNNTASLRHPLKNRFPTNMAAGN